jgi:hypothetical protein
MGERLKAVFKKTHPAFLPSRLRDRVEGRSRILYMMQLSLLTLLTAILILILVVSEGQRRTTYAALVGMLGLVILAATHLNLQGRHRLSAWITLAGITCAPWASLALDPLILQGDIVPLTTSCFPSTCAPPF